jgi:hypothetical protein
MKKVGEFEKTREKHLARQRAFDKIKKLKMLTSEEEWVSINEGVYGPMRLKLKKFDLESLWGGEQVLALVHGKLRSLCSPEKYSLGGNSIYLCDAYYAGFIPVKQVLAFVLSEHSRVPPKSQYHRS